jgi:hypothetical protein
MDEKYLQQIFKYYDINFVGLIGIVLVAIFIAFFTDKRYINSIFTLFISSFVTWIGHYFMHNYNTHNPIAWLHKLTHHSPFGETFWGKFIEYVIVEFFFFGGGILLLLDILWYRKYHFFILNPYVILVWTISVPYIHEVHYHLLNMSSFHHLHHLDTSYNYSPDYWDVYMNTKNNSHIENETLLLPHLAFIAILVILMHKSKYDFIKYFSK